MIKVAIDASGGDFGPEHTVYGSSLALSKNPDLKCLFFGIPEQIEQAIPDFVDRNRIEIISADEVIKDEENPLTAVRKKKNSSMIKGLKAVAEGQADSFVSAGNSGAIFTGALSIVGTLPEVKRPASVTMLPTISDSYYLLIDSGANILSKPEHLITYARLGSKLAEQLLGISNPKIGLLNIGTEASKGTSFTKEVYQLLSDEKNLNFTGNIEPFMLLHGTHDIVLTDGFTGNIMLKTIEGTAGILLNNLLHTIKSEANLNETAEKTVEGLIQSNIARYTNETIGGGFILGIKAPVVITHGAASVKMFQHSVELASKLARSNSFQG